MAGVTEADRRTMAGRLPEALSRAAGSRTAERTIRRPADSFGNLSRGPRVDTVLVTADTTMLTADNH